MFLLPEKWEEDEGLKQCKLDAIQIINSEFNRKNNIAIKDPRFGILLPFWKSVFETLQIKPKYCVVLRSPIEISLSLENRDQFSIQKSHILWTNYLMAIELSTRAEKRIFIDFPDFLKSPIGILKRHSRYFKLKNSFPLPEMETEIEAFVNPEHRHHNTSSKKSSDEIPAMVNEYSILLKQLAKNEKSDKEILTHLDQFYTEYLRSNKFFYNKDITNIKGVEELRNDNDTLKTHAAYLQNLLNGLNEKYNSTKNLNNDLNDHIKHLNQHVQESNKAFEHLKQQNDEKENTIQSQTKSLAYYEFRERELALDGDQKEKLIDELKSSITYQIGLFLTAPLRWVYDFFKALKFGKFIVWLKFIPALLLSPISLWRNINKNSIGTLRKALKYEDPETIYKNLITLLTGKRRLGQTLQPNIIENQIDNDSHSNVITGSGHKFSERIDKTLKSNINSILFISHDARLSGAQLILIHLTEWLAKHTLIDIKIITLEGGPLINRMKNVGHTIIWHEFTAQYPNSIERKKALREFCGDIDLVYGNTSVAPTIYSEIAHLNVPIITHVHELQLAMDKYISSDVINNMHHYSTAYIACSTPVENNLLERHDAAKKDFVKVYEFIDEYERASFSYDKNSLRKELGLETDKFIVIGCGTIYWRKGVDLFIDAAVKLKKLGKDNVQFYWLGNDYWNSGHKKGEYPSWEDLMQRIEQNGLIENIVFIGVKNNPRDYFLASDIYFLASREDPFPLSALEAAQCSLPIICFDKGGGIPEFVDHDAGIICPYEDTDYVAEKIAQLMDNDSLRLSLGKTARQKLLKRHTVDATAPKILEFIRNISSINPAVSIIVPNYNYEQYLPLRITSILNQTFKDFELILLDDYSTDNSMKIIEQYKHLPFVKIIANAANSGNVFKQWKKGIEIARGNLIWIAEADDYANPIFLESLVRKMMDEDIALAYSNSMTVDENNEVIGDYTSYYQRLNGNHWDKPYTVSANDEINLGLGVKNTVPNVSAVVFRKKYITEEMLQIASTFKLSGDWYIYVNLLKGHKITYEPEKLNYHRKHQQTVTSQTHGDEQKQIILDEAAQIHEFVKDHYQLKPDYVDRWDTYVSDQILALFPNVAKSEFNNYYPYDTVKNKIVAIENNNQNKKTAIIVTHAADLSGAPQIILKVAEYLNKKHNYNCLTFSLQEGVLLNNFRKYGETFVVDNNNIIKNKNISVKKYLSLDPSKYSFALVNTACCVSIMPDIEKNNIPLISFIHDYTYAWHENYLKILYDNSDHIVYSTQFMVEKNKHDYNFDLNKTSIIPQGLYKEEFLDADLELLRSETRKKLVIPENAFVVMGCGSIHPRKGIDVFIQTAIQTISLAPEKDIYFIWLGGTLQSNSPDMYIRFLHRDIVNTNNENRILFYEPVVNVVPYYAASDLFFLSSREDPFPTIVFEAFISELPVIGVEGSSGAIELLKRCKNFVVPYTGRAEVSQEIVKLIDQPKILAEAGKMGKELILKEFKFEDYVDKILQLIHS
jgi:glycosyltransferase involved in cell wall biosynthesis